MHSAVGKTSYLVKIDVGKYRKTSVPCVKDHHSRQKSDGVRETRNISDVFRNATYVFGSYPMLYDVFPIFTDYHEVTEPHLAQCTTSINIDTPSIASQATLYFLINIAMV